MKANLFKLITMKLLLFWISLFLMLENNINPDSDPSAIEVFNKISTKYSSFKTLKIFFDYRQTDIETKHITQQSGTLFLKKGLNKYKIENENLELFVDSEHAYTYIKDTNELYISNIDDNFKALNPFDLININTRDKDYKVVSDSNPNDQYYNVIIFVLKETPFYKIEFIIDKKKMLIKKINFNDRFGYYYEYSILKESHDINLSDVFFNFNKEDHPNIEVIDYRLLDDQ